MLPPFLDKKLIYDNAACRLNKGTHFAQRRVSGFLREYYNKYGLEGYFLKCDIKKYFDNIDHDILKSKLDRIIEDKEVLGLLFLIIDSYEKTRGLGLPLGNQTSQWFAIYYLDGFDRCIKEKLKIKYYSRYMDDCVLIYSEKEYLKQCLAELKTMLENELHLEFNTKTQIAPLRNGIDYLGFRFYLTESGKVIRKVRQQTKYKYKRKLAYMKQKYNSGQMELGEIKQILASYHAHLEHGHTYRLRTKCLKQFILQKKTKDIDENR